MIISFRHRFIFVAIPKTATHALRVALRPHLGPRDWEQCGLFEKKTFPVAALAQIGHGHITCQQVRPFLLPELWESSFRFCTVRNPYDRFVSYCYFMNRENQRMQKDPLGTMKQIIEHKQDAEQVLFRPQCEFVIDEEGRLMVNYVSKFEALQNDFDDIRQRLRLPDIQLQPINVTGSALRRFCYDGELKEMVQTVYRQDFALFDYPLDLPVNASGPIAPPAMRIGL